MLNHGPVQLGLGMVGKAAVVLEINHHSLGHLCQLLFPC